MPLFAILVGLALTFLGLDGYFGFVNVLGVDPSELRSGRAWTALIPAILGLPLLVCGVLAFDEKRLKHAMHAAATLGLLGVIGGGGRLLMKLAQGSFEWRPSAYSQMIMAGLCLVFVIGCVFSFINARKRRQAREQAGL